MPPALSVRSDNTRPVFMELYADSPRLSAAVVVRLRERVMCVCKNVWTQTFEKLPAPFCGDLSNSYLLRLLFLHAWWTSRHFPLATCPSCACGAMDHMSIFHGVFCPMDPFYGPGSKISRRVCKRLAIFPSSFPFGFFTLTHIPGVKN